MLDTIGIYKNSVYYNNWLRKEHVKKTLPIPSIENGVDSFELRVESEGRRGYGLYHIIKCVDGEWMGETIWYRCFYPDYGWDSITMKRFMPKCGWKAFMDTLNNSGLYNLPDQSQINGWENGVCDGYVVTFEIATKHSYKRFSYGSPEAYADSADKKVAAIQSFLYRNY